jgi:WD40 repeat protein
VGRGLTATDADGRQRLDDADDIVRLEIAAALERNIRVIPILFEGAVMPRRHQLPESLARLARRNALILRHESFRADVDRLLAAIEPILRHPAALAPSSSEPVSAAPVRSRSGQAMPEGVDPADIDPFPSEVQVLWHSEDVNGVAFSPDGRLLGTASDDRTARVWEVVRGRERVRLAHKGRVWGLAFDPDGRLLATASDETARIWDIGSGRERARVAHEETVWAVAFSPDGSLLATASSDRTARVWEVASGQERARVTHKETVRAVAISPNGRQLATGSFDGSASVWALVR